VLKSLLLLNRPWTASGWWAWTSTSPCWTAIAKNESYMHTARARAAENRRGHSQPETMRWLVLLSASGRACPAPTTHPRRGEACLAPPRGRGRNHAVGHWCCWRRCRVSAWPRGRSRRTLEKSAFGGGLEARSNTCAPSRSTWSSTRIPPAGRSWSARRAGGHRGPRRPAQHRVRRARAGAPAGRPANPGAGHPRAACDPTPRRLGSAP